MGLNIYNVKKSIKLINIDKIENIFDLPINLDEKDIGCKIIWKFYEIVFKKYFFFYIFGIVFRCTLSYVL